MDIYLRLYTLPLKNGNKLLRIDLQYECIIKFSNGKRAKFLIYNIQRNKSIGFYDTFVLQLGLFFLKKLRQEKFSPLP